MKLASLLLLFVASVAEAGEPLSYYTITPPCRWIDTRRLNQCSGLDETLQGYPNCPIGPFRDAETRYFNAQNAAACRRIGPDGVPFDQVPLGAKAVAVNVTVVDAMGRGHLVVYNGTLTSPYVDSPQRPPTSNINFAQVDARSNFMIVELGQLQFQDPVTPWWPDTAIYARIVGGGTAHVIADIVGYFARP